MTEGSQGIPRLEELLSREPGGFASDLDRIAAAGRGLSSRNAQRAVQEAVNTLRTLYTEMNKAR